MGYDAEATRRRIFQAATAEFAARGLAGARIDRIATEARANKQAIYLYFGSKEKLFGAVVRAKMAEIGHATDIDPDSLAESVGRLFDWYREHPELVRLLLWEALETPDRTQGEAERREEFQRKARHFTEHGAGGGTPDPDRSQAVQDLMFTVFGLIAWNFAVPQLRRIVLDEEDEAAALARRRASVMEAARVLAESHGFG
ncbi:TetR/AcrR family transcriptional regulator [Actinomadura madurae]|uniref:DNA-binding transcriptional regulator, AcrR family n=1 Tax=Actinomadura madurae TaxID=1993 RepID=A0A1I5L8T0_9ACTN|nr:TetR family transcriptional regulator [Actinomadura madurae]MCP9949563.1 TetR family transcriptional regulator [Actinomadura madurae]MCP9966319.1 TetR family transcriptional regulator [Actinomadura madurae]MCP9978807.1 TetR family transcriptional regulator [Actinomadura madurae]MCQ0009666.1 TetR family transcriptional regulator [Actinomadura madurae]URM95104.1 TetR family transcriptional regulator [Actinomadura madurae]